MPRRLLIDSEGTAIQTFEQVRIEAGSAFDEKWLQATIFENIELMHVADPAFERAGIVPLCREFSLRGGSSNQFLDILGVTELGKLVLIECKLISDN